MFVLVGLGNPGDRYQNTRHNAGFLLLDYLAEKYDISVIQKKFNSFFGRGFINEKEVILVKPQTFMNRSGESVQQVLNFFKVPETRLIVLFDDLDLPLGQVKMRFGGGHGGHNGVRNILECLPSDEFYRIKIGIGKPEHKNDTADWVLHALNKEELNTLINEVFPAAKDRIFNIMREAKKDL